MTDTQTNSPCCLKWLAQNHRLAAYGFLVLALVPLGCAVWWGIQAYSQEPGVSRLDLITLTFWAGTVAVVLIATGLYELVNAPATPEALEATRLMIAAVGGALGLVTALAGAVLAYAWWNEVTSWLTPQQAKQLWKGGVVVLALFGGLGLMFASLQVARADERSNPVVRRVLYGYTAVMTGLLLLAVLGVVDALLYNKLPQSLDFTTSSIYSLSPRSKAILKGLDQPTKVYMIMSSQDPLSDEVRTLLINCREVNPNIDVEVKSPSNDEWLREMSKKYTTLGRVGLLVLYGEGDSPDYRFIQRDDLFTIDDRRRMRRDPNEKEGFRFKGEDAFMTALDSLSQGKDKTVLYVTQGNGELDLKDSQENHQEGMGLLSERLKKRNLEINPLTFTAGTARVPDDATMVVIAGPRRDLPEPAVNALREYLNRPGKARGKLLVMLEPPTTAEPQNRLQEFLRGLNVNAPPERLLSLSGYPDRPSPTMVVAGVPMSDTGSNPLASAFEGVPFRFVEARPVNPGSTPAGPGGGRYQAETLMLAPGLQSRSSQPIWVEKNLDESASKLADDQWKQVEQNKLGKLSLAPIAVAVTVTEGDPQDPHAGMTGAPPPQQSPRLVVFGDSTFASNFFMRENARSPSFDLVAGCVDWLRERPTSIGIEPKSRNLFQMPVEPRPWPLTWIPTVLICTAILGLGAGVWVVRRR